MTRKRIRHYDIKEELGRGGMGIVYLARDTRLKRDVAIKFLPPHIASSPAERQRFETEAQAAASLSHPNIATIHSIEDVDDEVCIVMEYVDGVELKDHITEHGLPLDETLRIAREIAKGLREAHENGIVHRDIKSRNIMITGAGRAKIMDFGLAKVSGDTRITKTGTTLGTIAYMSPEQAKGEEVDARTDIWSFGVVLYEMLTGRLPFGGEHEAAVLYSVVNAPHEGVRAHRPEIPQELAAVVDRALAKHPDERYATIGELIADLDRASGSNDVSIATGQTGRPARPAGSRGRRTGFVIGGFVLVAVVLFFVVGRLISPSTPSARSIAVLPFVNERGDPDIEYLSDGITESLIGHLSPISDLRVMARSTVFRFKGSSMDPIEVGKELHVATVLAGRLDQVGEKLVVGAELIDVASGAQLWGERFNRTMTDILAIEAEISQNIADKLRVELAGSGSESMEPDRALNAEAYHFYLRGRYHWNKRSPEAMPHALAAFQKAIDIAPDYAPAWSGLADCYTVGWGGYLGLPAEEAYRKGIAAVRRALELDDGLAEAHASYAMTELLEHQWDWEGAERELRRAIDLNPGYVSAHQWYGELLYLTGRYDEAFAEIQRALDIDPLSLIVNSVLGWAFVAARDGERALEQLDRTLDMEPDFIDALHGRSYALLLVGGRDQEVIETLLATDIGIGLDIRWEGGTLADYWRTRRDSALAQGDKAPKNFLLECYAQLGEKEKALDLLEDMAARREPSLSYINVFGTLDPLRSEPRFRAVVEEMGLNPYRAIEP